MRGIEEGSPWIKCPRCGMASYHPMDVRTGFCSNCQGFTSQPLDLDKTAGDELKRVVYERTKSY